MKLAHNDLYTFNNRYIVICKIYYKQKTIFLSLILKKKSIKKKQLEKKKGKLDISESNGQIIK